MKPQPGAGTGGARQPPQCVSGPTSPHHHPQHLPKNQTHKTLPAFSSLPSAERERPGTRASTGEGTRAAEQFGAASGTEERWLRFSTQQVAAARGPGPNRRSSPPDSGASPQTPGGSLRPAAPHNISRCKWPNRKTRRENYSQSGAADSGVPPPFARPWGSPSHPAPLRGGVSQLLSSPGRSGGPRRGGGVCHLVTLILASSQTHPSSLSQSSCWCC
ncbi:uncharacterized protein LOC112413728 [Neophocaena asiaeorientalis asiaeorientalis]|uniref:Uncharacterized protein LOC112413728 n=1 Tax=Neophocaena asiaeorientalis asiaeorientalis TaxID=1706337 RepID=A0A341D3M2_NEOAA|nr:uncharacterized protein LOC112413728 [Neophocaena asiaeorientalis asiaeorientalis]